MAELDYIAGDSIRIFTRYGSRLTTVLRVTPTGRVVTDSRNGTFDKYGRLIGGSSWSSTYIYPKAQAAERHASDLKQEAERKAKLSFDARLVELTRLTLRDSRAKIITELRELLAIAEAAP